MDALPTILTLLDKMGISDTQFEKALSLPHSTVYNWKGGRSHSYNKLLGRIADYFGVTTDYLLGKVICTARDGELITLTDDEFILFGIVDELSPSGIEKVIDYANYVLSQENARLNKS